MTMRIDNEIYDLSEFNDGSFNNLFMLSLGTGIQYPINKSTLIYTHIIEVLIIWS